MRAQAAAERERRWKWIFIWPRGRICHYSFAMKNYRLCLQSSNSISRYYYVLLQLEFSSSFMNLGTLKPWRRCVSLRRALELKPRLMLHVSLGCLLPRKEAEWLDLDLIGTLDLYYFFCFALLAMSKITWETNMMKRYFSRCESSLATFSIIISGKKSLKQYYGVHS